MQQEVEERDRLIHSFGSENQRLQQLLQVSHTQVAVWTRLNPNQKWGSLGNAVFQDHEEALEDLEKRIAGVQKEKEKEAEANRRQADELKHLWEREERSRREKEVRRWREIRKREETEVKKRLTCPCLMSLQLSDQRVKSLESSVEAERATHRESKFKSELIQVTRAHVVSDRAVLNP